ncbi:MAG: bifunctional phosphoribosyl-AMP cyclohydrolase/phosphoribosyl-ATP diphosphatase HisIE [Labilithrix sp.]|nr:bifunctional phosphoribosyl-AMP cyclohydrolase/phosphoribosyl-ATP diphosphatase HisIE [Labilithrix sp.]MBX3223851.1 bifunctional phosphoribosyl-AMP cyclohydrolase/phosphoribosyl-ATP diphosphatase HisIE [Labilithrix sp.]
MQFERKGDVDVLPVVAQDHVTGEIRMLAWATPEAVRATLESGHATFYSRSRAELWEKGKTSGNALEVLSVLVDCDADALVYLVAPRGPTCHTGAPSCFFRRLTDAGEIEEPAGASTLLARLDAVLLARRAADAEKSYAKSLYDGGAAKIGEKLREEADELARAVAEESADRVVSEAADVLFHVMVALRSRDVGVEDVLRELSRRAGTGGHDEKKLRKPKGVV